MANQEAIDKVRELIKDIKVAMLTTISIDGSLHSRPMQVKTTDANGDVWFMTNKQSVKVDEIEQNPRVNVAFSDPGDDAYVSLSGTIQIVDDRAKIEELWSAIDKAWFPDGKSDPNICLLKVDPEVAEYWDLSNRKIVQVFGFVKALASGEAYNNEGANHGKLDL